MKMQQLETIKEEVKTETKPETKVEPKTGAKTQPKASGKLAAVLIRGLINIGPGNRDTLKMLNLDRKHGCIIIENTPSNRGMLTRVKDYVAWGEVSDDTCKELVAKRTEKKVSKTKSFFRLSPPKGGFERKGIKKSFQKGGALGYRGEKMNDLLRKML